MENPWADEGNVWGDFGEEDRTGSDTGWNEWSEEPIQVDEVVPDPVSTTVEPEVESEEQVDSDNTSFGSFGSFESIAKPQLKLDIPLTTIVDKIFPAVSYSERESESPVDSKIYDRLWSQQTTTNQRLQAEWDNSDARKHLADITRRWYEVECNVDSESMVRELSPDSNLFGWSTGSQRKVPKKEEQKPATKAVKLNAILTSAAYNEVRKILDEQLRRDALERQRLSKERAERERRLSEERRKRNDDAKRYQVSRDQSPSKEKRGFFGKIFKRKSKIAQEHLSSGKVSKASMSDDDDEFAAAIASIDRGHRDDGSDDSDVGYDEVGAELTRVQTELGSSEIPPEEVESVSKLDEQKQPNEASKNLPDLNKKTPQATSPKWTVLRPTQQSRSAPVQQRAPELQHEPVALSAPTVHTAHTEPPVTANTNTPDNLIDL